MIAQIVMLFAPRFAYATQNPCHFLCGPHICAVKHLVDYLKLLVSPVPHVVGIDVFGTLDFNVERAIFHIEA